MHTLRPFQTQALQALKQNSHVICVAPTGSGKSLIYETEAALPGRRTLLVSPLVALGRQQASRLRNKGVSVNLKMGSDSTKPDPNKDDPKSAVWICSPEFLFSDNRKGALFNRWKPNFLVVDECHCLWEWGDQFRPLFKKLPSLLDSAVFDFKIQKSLWLTASLPPAARSALRSSLPDPIHEIGEFGLPKALHFRTMRVPWLNRPQALIHSILSKKAPGIVFASTKSAVERIARLLATINRRVVIYHSGLSKEERIATELAISQNSIDVVVATSAFGMGMDYPALSWVTLWQAPLSLLSLTQAIGRVGRGNQAGEALVMWDNADFELMNWAARNSERASEDLVKLYEFLNSPSCRCQSLSAYFGTNRSACFADLSCDFCSQFI